MHDFVIVIEVDNKRAHAAYQKGLSDLEALWPQVQSFAEHRDAIDEAKKKVAKAELDSLLAEKAEYDERARKWDSSLFKLGERPEAPFGMTIEIMRKEREVNGGILYLSSEIEHYESLRAELKRKVDLSDAALGPFRMTEHQVAEMIEWEDGSRIEEIKQFISERQEKPTMNKFKLVPVEPTESMTWAAANDAGGWSVEDLEKWQAMRAAAPSPWINVEERLPQAENKAGESGYVLTHNDLDGVDIGFYCHGEGIWCDRLGSEIEPDFAVVTHWMPLPEAPEVK